MKTLLFLFLFATPFTLATVFWKKEIKIDINVTKNDPEKRVAHTTAYISDLKRIVLLDGYHPPGRTPLKGDVWTRMVSNAELHQVSDACMLWHTMGSATKLYCMAAETVRSFLVIPGNGMEGAGTKYLK